MFLFLCLNLAFPPTWTRVPSPAALWSSVSMCSTECEARAGVNGLSWCHYCNSSVQRSHSIVPATERSFEFNLYQWKEKSDRTNKPSVSRAQPDLRVSHVPDKFPGHSGGLRAPVSWPELCYQVQPCIRRNNLQLKFKQNELNLVTQAFEGKEYAYYTETIQDLNTTEILLRR
jgi:hypothetical protein